MELEKASPLQDSSPTPARAQAPIGARRCRRKFLRFFPKGFQDAKYVDWERGYKWQAHQQWKEALDRRAYEALLRENGFGEIAARAVRIESRTNLLFSFEKMALRDAVKSTAGAQVFAEGLYDFLHGRGSEQRKFERWCGAVEALPRKQTRVLTWPLVTVFGFLAQPETHVSKTERDAGRRPRVWLRFSVRLTASLANVRKPDGVCSDRAPGLARPAAARHDRHSIIHLGARV